MTDGEVAFGVITAFLAVAAIGVSIWFGVFSHRKANAAEASAAEAKAIAERSAVAAEQSADAAARSAAEAKRSNELAIEAAERQRFVWWIDVAPGSNINHMNYVLRNDGTDTAEDVVLVPGPPPEPGMAIPEFRDLPNGATIHGHGSHEFYIDPGLGEVLPRQMLLRWRGHENPRPLRLPST